MFRVSTLDLANLPRDDSGRVDFSQDFFGRESYLTVSGQLNVGVTAWHCRRSTPSGLRSVPKTPIQADTLPSFG